MFAAQRARTWFERGTGRISGRHRPSGRDQARCSDTSIGFRRSTRRFRAATRSRSGPALPASDRPASSRKPRPAGTKLFEQRQVPAFGGHIVFRANFEPQVPDGAGMPSRTYSGLNRIPVVGGVMASQSGRAGGPLWFGGLMPAQAPPDDIRQRLPAIFLPGPARSPTSTIALNATPSRLQLQWSRTSWDVLSVRTPANEAAQRLWGFSANAPRLLQTRSALFDARRTSVATFSGHEQ